MRQPMPVPLWMLLFDAAGALLLALGIVGLTLGARDDLGLLSRPALAWTLVAIGVVVMAAALVMIVRRLRHDRGDLSAR